MKIGLLSFELDIVNTALMQVSTYHKNKGDHVEMFSPLFKYDKIYGFSIFSFSDKSNSHYCDLLGGTGIDIETKLPEDIEKENYDWDMYPKCDYSIIWFSRGCIRNCPWCVVPKKEGMIKAVLPKNLNPNGKYIRVMDNNFFANPEWKKAIKQLIKWNQPIDFEGIDARLLTKEQCTILNSLNHRKQIHIAWDNPKEDLEPILKQLTQWIKPYKLMCYVLVGFNSTKEEDMHRIKTLTKYKIDPYVMPFDTTDQYQKDLKRWCNRVALRKSCTFEEYNPRKKKRGDGADSSHS
jgi:hypothetical protein